MHGYVIAEWKHFLIGYDELITAPILITPIGKVPADDYGNLPAPVQENKAL